MEIQVSMENQMFLACGKLLRVFSSWLIQSPPGAFGKNVMSGMEGRRRVESWVESPGVPSDPVSAVLMRQGWISGDGECQRACVVRRARCCGREGPEEVRPLRGDEGSFR